MNIEPAQLFRALADQTRLRCLALLMSRGELCVCELTDTIGVAQPKVSRHLATLRGAGIVADRRAGQRIYYRLQPALPAWARRVLRAALPAADGPWAFSSDRVSVRRGARRTKSGNRESSAADTMSASGQNSRLPLP